MPDTVLVEFYSVPRLRAGRADLAVRPGTVRDVLAQVEAACPKLGPLLTDAGRPVPHFLLSLDGERFVDDPDEPLAAGARLLLLSADAGG